MEMSGGSMAWEHFRVEADLRKLAYSDADVAKVAESFRCVLVHSFHFGKPSDSAVQVLVGARGVSFTEQTPFQHRFNTVLTPVQHCSNNALTIFVLCTMIMFICETASDTVVRF
jgi:hypothetical protein